MELTKEGQAALDIILKAAKDNSINIKGSKVRRTSSRFCLGVEHGDYNGTELFGFETGGLIWLVCKPSGTDDVRFFGGSLPYHWMTSSGKNYRLSKRILVKLKGLINLLFDKERRDQEVVKQFVENVEKIYNENGLPEEAKEIELAKLIEKNPHLSQHLAEARQLRKC